MYAPCYTPCADPIVHYVLHMLLTIQRQRRALHPETTKLVRTSSLPPPLPHASVQPLTVPFLPPSRVRRRISILHWCAPLLLPPSCVCVWCVPRARVTLLCGCRRRGRRRERQPGRTCGVRRRGRRCIMKGANFSCSRSASRYCEYGQGSLQVQVQRMPAR